VRQAVQGRHALHFGQSGVLDRLTMQQGAALLSPDPLSAPLLLPGCAPALHKPPHLNAPDWAPCCAPAGGEGAGHLQPFDTLDPFEIGIACQHICTPGAARPPERPKPRGPSRCLAISAPTRALWRRAAAVEAPGRNSLRGTPGARRFTAPHPQLCSLLPVLGSRLTGRSESTRRETMPRSSVGRMPRRRRRRRRRHTPLPCVTAATPGAPPAPAVPARPHEQELQLCCCCCPAGDSGRHPA
jgi:hypothetical protein